MVFWVREEFPPVASTRPTMSLSKANIFSGINSFLSRVIFYGLVFADGEITLEVSLERNVYTVGEPLSVSVQISSRPSRRVSSVRVSAVQAVDVAMFTSGYFKVINDILRNMWHVG